MWRTWSRRVASLPADVGSKKIWPKIRSESDWPKPASAIGRLTVTSSPGSRSWSTFTLAPSTTAGFSRSVVAVVPDRALQHAVDEGQVGVDLRGDDLALGADRPERLDADGKVPNAGRITLDDVEAGAGATEHVARDRRRQERAAGNGDLVGPARWREHPEVDLGRALGRVRGAADDPDLVDDQAAAPEGVAEGVRAQRRTRR